MIPVGIFVLGALVFAGVYFFVIRPNKNVSLEDEDAKVPPIPLEMRPVASLTPSIDGHWLKLVIEGIKIEAYSMDYELLYKVGDGRTQGVPGTIQLKGEKSLERDLLLGSESSGKFRYDEGVETGTLTLRFRNDKGKLVGKLSTDWHLVTDTDELTSVDNKFTYNLTKASKGTWFVVMETFGLPDEAPGTLTMGPYGVFASEEGSFAGTASNMTHFWSGSAWKEISSSKSSDVGIFIQVASE
ncbi:hypothetical protein A3F62_03835 [Candidatus Woesebacteria bacterium RIFCSPHIGHO2_12_FULL_44_11]|uniref:Uncharacterized protein n=1 Tax=Candidatus Woesebacteria bacterium RIFCSPLOWO2_01_FULL_44_14 TaxID=1802525 RepID=A0A1F8C4Y0_9BACT|nr:MAG: hypothetical protein A3F62_03835 [Candidatus Woesebacteria bacterium RIFCSPHIGHO2_12_FULL_44_11]OGM70745.1 MAG: hypothetical protein A2975_02545 [Candidatus Woesebacteria bacterium RIFCSPLOWO2_01_FULL_44_14]